MRENELVLSSFVVSFALAIGCGDSTGGGTESSSAASSTEGSSGSTTTTTTATTTATSTTTDDGSTSHPHDTETESTGHGSSGGATTGPVDATPEDYCACMLINCHDQYHGTWGEDHEMSEQGCLAAAGALPTVGMPATSGNSLECRVYYCEAATSDVAACASAIGGGECT